MTREQWTAAGYTSANPCDPGIGVRIFNQPLWDAQFYGRKPDPQNPPILFADRNAQRIIGVQWITSPDTQPVPVLFGQKMMLLAAGDDPRLVLFSWFKPNGYVLFGRSVSPDPCR